MSELAWYHARLRGENLPLPDANHGVVRGFWRTRRKLIGVATWMANGVMVQKTGDNPVKAVTLEWAESIFSDAVQQPVPEKDYREWRDTGRWPDTPPVVDPDPVDPDERDALRGIGDNSGQPDALDMGDAPADESVFAALTRELAAEKAAVEKWLNGLTITTKADADKCANWADRITKLEKRIEEAFEVEKKPLREAAKACDDKWREPRNGSEALKKALKRALLPYLSEQERLAREHEAAERRRKAEEQRARDEAERTANGYDSEHGPETTPPSNRQPARDHRAEQERPQANAGSGGARKATLRGVWKAQIDDYEKALLALKGHPEMKAFVQTLCDRAAKAGVEVDGVTFYEDKTVA